MKLKKLFKPAAVILLIGGTSAFVRSDFWMVHRIDCRQNGQPCSFEAWTGFFSQLNGRNWLFLSSEKYEKRFADTYPVFSSVKITKIFPSTILVELTTRNPVLAVRKKHHYYLLDSQGLVLGAADHADGLPELSLGGSESYLTGQIATDPVSAFSARLLAEAQWRLLSPLTVEPEGKWTVRLIFSEGTVGVFSVQKDPASQLDSLQFILSRTKMEGRLPGKVDLRFDKPVVVYEDN